MSKEIKTSFKFVIKFEEYRDILKNSENSVKMSYGIHSNNSTYVNNLYFYMYYIDLKAKIKEKIDNQEEGIKKDISALREKVNKDEWVFQTNVGKQKTHMF